MIGSNMSEDRPPFARTVLVGGTPLYRCLVAEGFIVPPECGDVELHMPVDGLLQLKYVENVTEERLGMLGRALVRLAERRYDET